MHSVKTIVAVGLCTVAAATLFTACRVAKKPNPQTPEISLSEGVVTQTPLFTAAPSPAKTQPTATDSQGNTMPADECNGISILVKTTPVRHGEVALVTVIAAPSTDMTLEMEGGPTVKATTGMNGVGSFNIPIADDLAPGLHALNIHTDKGNDSAITYIEIK